MRVKAAWNAEMGIFVGQEHTLAQIIHNATKAAVEGNPYVPPADVLVIWDDAEKQWVFELESEHVERSERFGQQRNQHRTIWYRIDTEGKVYGL